MRKFLPWIIAGGLLLIIGFWYISIKNGAVRVNQEVNKEWGNVETSYQRRNDLIGNLVKTVQGSADFEKSTLEAVIKARSEATSVKIDPTNMTPEQLTQFNQAQGNLNSSLSRLLVTVEQYPDLKANQNFAQLQTELTDTENKIQAARRFYNGNVRDLKIALQQFPSNIVGNMFNFKEEQYFELAEGSVEKEVVKVAF